MDKLSNKWLEIDVSEEGAEMHRIVGKLTQVEYLWNGDAKYWDRHSPLLFPLVGKLRNGETKIGGTTYRIPKHGFISDVRFEKIEQTPHSIVYHMESTEDMLEMYPFPFALDVTYKLRANYVTVLWKIYNLGRVPMPFHIGGHPGINYPQFSTNTTVKAYASFRKGSPIESAAVSTSGCLSNYRYDLPLDKDGLLALTDKSFHNDAIIVDNRQVKQISLLDTQKQPYVTLDFNSPVLLLWSPYGIDAPFVCLEPWYGLCDADSYEGEFSHRPYTTIVEPGRNTQLGYTLRMDAEISRQAMSVKKFDY